MSYIDGFVIACPKSNKQDFIRHAETADGVFMDLGATRILECWQDDVQKGETTDFFMAVQAKDDEAVLFSWIEWPDRQTRDAAMEKLRAPDFSDPRMDPEKNRMPFDGTRLIFGGFVPVVTLEK
ncbi:MAG: DUF1428 domain-containing protein [Pseudomonadales bacterium]|nr:DUF1428 domain-containing protein [Pseudomonadales bacterium]